MTTRTRSRGRTRSFGRQKRNYQWNNSQIAPATVGAGGVVNTVLSAGVFPDELAKGVMVHRILGLLRVDSTDANLSVDFVAAISMRQNTSTITASAADYPFLWWMRSSALPAAGPSERFPIDVKSRRLFRWNDNDLVFQIENNDSAQALEYIFGLRILYSLP